MDNEMFLELVHNMLPYQDEIMEFPTTDDNLSSMDDDDGMYYTYKLKICAFNIMQSWP